ncbi:hypothetical protein IL306_012006 [Fusarium sp. DS 682]|nr:hypothetical protein IL306_012006 [Fusarium sp. DS 682]
MWPNGPSFTETTTLYGREAELLADSRFFGVLVSQRAISFRHNEDGVRNPFREAASAKRIVAHIIGRLRTYVPEVLQLQREIIDQHKTLGETTAGIAANVDLHKARRSHECQVRELKMEMKGQLAKRDAAHAAELGELAAHLERELRRNEDDTKALKKTMEDMHAEKVIEKCLREKMKDLDKQFRHLLADKEQELLDMKESLREISDDVAQRSQQTVRVQQVAEHQKIVDCAQKEVIQAREAYQKFQTRTDQVINGSANGVAAGVTTAVVTAGKINISA